MTERSTGRTAKIIALLHEKVRLEPFHRRLFYSVFGILWGSGALWLLIEWFKDPELGAARTLLQTFAMDFVPLLLLFAVSVTGLALTASTLWLRGAYYPFLSLLHAVCVIGWLLQLPFGKFFHIFQRPAQLGVKLYHRAGGEGEGARCARCGERFASRMHVDDLKEILPRLGFEYAIAGPAGNWQELCPPCKRKSLAMAQLRLKEETGG